MWPGNVAVMVHDVHGSPVFVTISWPCMPPLVAGGPGHEFITSYRTLQDTAANAGSVDTATAPVAATAATATMAIFRLEKRLKPSLMPVSPTCVRVRQRSGVAVAGCVP